MPVLACVCPGFSVIFWRGPALFWQGLQKSPALRRAFRFILPSGGSGRLLLVVVLVDFLEIGIDHVGVLGGIRLGVGFRCFLLRGLVHGLAKLHRSFGEHLALGLDVGRIVAFGG